MRQYDENGLTQAEASRLLEKYGKNEISGVKKKSLFMRILGIITEPMFLLLIIASAIYFILGNHGDGAIMLVFVVGIILIDIIQELKTDHTLARLRQLSAPQACVIRDGKETNISSSDIVPGDLLLICEGAKIPADGFVVSCNDLCVDESTLTGESVPLRKTATEDNSDSYWKTDYCYAGTLVTQGNAVVLVEKTGVMTEYGKIGRDIASVKDEKTPLQKQTSRVVRICSSIAAFLFIAVGIITWFNQPSLDTGARLIACVLSGITLAMAMIPEEFPVILTVFLSMGAWRLAKKKSLVRKLPSVETLGSVTVLCVDKTGTITQNKMEVSQLWACDEDKTELCETMGLGCETAAYDPMETAMLDYCDKIGIGREHIFGGELLQEYSFTDELKMMGHVHLHDGEIVIAVKGSPESVFGICTGLDSDKATAQAKIMSQNGLRVIAVAKTVCKSRDEIPQNILDCKLTLLGLVGLSDPPRKGVEEHIKTCKSAGIRVKMITGDNGVTAAAIASKVGIGNGEFVTGAEMDSMSETELQNAVEKFDIFARVRPEHKMRIVKALSASGEIVAMTGDGVNDAPALKAADIGISMGGSGSEVSREAADLILTDDDFSVIVDTVRDGRRIFDNIRRAFGYVFSIHIPIALASLLAPVLVKDTSALFLLPLHVVLLELIIDPTCSIVLERQPSEPDIMRRKPRLQSEGLLTKGTFIKSVLQGLCIFAASFSAYYFSYDGSPETAALARTFGLAVIVFANLFLVVVNTGGREYAFCSLKRLLKDRVMQFSFIAVLAGLAAVLYSPLNTVLKTAPLPLPLLLAAFGLGAVSVVWYELVKLFKNHRENKSL